MSEQPECPECERLHEVAPESQKIGEFLEWLRGQKQIMLAQYHAHSKECRASDGDLACGYRRNDLEPVRNPTEKILAEYFKIDLDKVENERRTLLDYLRSNKKDEVTVRQETQ